MKTTGNTILITGGALGIGFALASKFASLNNKVIICDILKVSLINARKKIGDLRIEVCDVTNDESVKNLAKKLEEEEGGINVLINNAGVGKYHDLLDEKFSVEDALDEINVNFLGTVRLIKHFLPQLQKRKDSVIINISAGQAYIPYHKSPIYSASKSAIHSYTTVLRHQLKSRNQNIKVVEVFPTIIDTRMSQDQVHRMPSEMFSEILIKELESDKTDIRIGTKRLYFMSRFAPKWGFNLLNLIMDQKIEVKKEK
jgi:uncharacterized oxidoreductase